MIKLGKKTTATLLIAIFILSTLTIAIPTASAQTTYYVAKTGDDTTGDGSEGSPWLTIQHAIGEATGSDTIIVAVGTYTENLVIGKQLTLEGVQAGVDARGRTGDESIIAAPVGTGPGQAITITANEVIVDGFTVIDNPEGGNPEAAIFLDAVDNCVIKNNIITDFYPTGINLYSDGADYCDHNTITKNSLTPYYENIDFTAEFGIKVKGSDNTISDNEIEGCNNAAIHIWSADGCSETVSPDHNVISGNTLTGLYKKYEGGAIWVKTGSYTEVTNNIITDANNGIIIVDYEDSNWGWTERSHDNLISGNEITGSDSPVQWPWDWLPGMEGNTAGMGIFLYDVHASTITGNTITNFANSGLLFCSCPDNSVHYNNIDGNEFGLENLDTEVILDAENNWWGSNTGPYHYVTNTDGEGDDVSDNVDYDPWLGADFVTVTASVQAPIVSISVTPTSIDFGDVALGRSYYDWGTQYFTVVNDGETDVYVTAELLEDDGFYADSLYLGEGVVDDLVKDWYTTIYWSEEISPAIVGYGLTIARDAELGVHNGLLVFWAQEPIP